MARSPRPLLLVLLVVLATSITLSSAAQQQTPSRVLLDADADAPLQPDTDTDRGVPADSPPSTPPAQQKQPDSGASAPPAGVGEEQRLGSMLAGMPFLDGFKVDGAYYTHGGPRDGFNLWDPATPGFNPVPNSGNAVTGSASRIPIRNNWTELAAQTINITAGGVFQTQWGASFTTTGSLSVYVSIANTTNFNYTLAPPLVVVSYAATATLRSQRFVGCSLQPQFSSFPVPIAADMWPDTGAITLSVPAYVLRNFTFPQYASAQYQLTCPCTTAYGTLQRRGTPCARCVLCRWLF